MLRIVAQCICDDCDREVTIPTERWGAEGLKDALASAEASALRMGWIVDEHATLCRVCQVGRQADQAERTIGDQA